MNVLSKGDWLLNTTENAKSQLRQKAEPDKPCFSVSLIQFIDKTALAISDATSGENVVITLSPEVRDFAIGYFRLTE